MNSVMQVLRDVLAQLQQVQLGYVLGAILL